MKKRKFRINVDPQSLVPVDSVRKYYYLSILLIIIMLGIIVGMYQFLPRSVPLFFTKPWGIEMLAPKPYLYILPIISFLVVSVNVIVGKMMSIDNNKIVVHSLGIGSFAVTLTLFLSLVGILQSIL